MMENESLRGSRNTSTVLLVVLLVLAVCWAVIATAMAVKRNRELAAKSAELQQFQYDAQQRQQDMERRFDEVRKQRDGIYSMMRQHQQKLQADMRAKQAQSVKKTAPAPVKKSSR